MGLDNYGVPGMPHMHTSRVCFDSLAFSFEQMVPQKLSWIIHVKNVQAIMRLFARSKVSWLDLAHGADPVSTFILF